MPGPVESGAIEVQAPSVAAIFDQLNRVLASRALKPSERLCGFLQFVVEKASAGEAAEIKEYSIATAVYGRPESFDPKADSIVRVEASRLRSKLREYYASEGADDPIMIELPKGTYAPVFTRRGCAVAPASMAPVAAPAAQVVAVPVTPSRRWWIAAIPFVLGAIAFLGYQGMRRPPPSLDVSEFAAVAVMPFLDLSLERGGERVGQQLAAGLSEDIALALGQSKDLRVVSPRSIPGGKQGRPGLAEVRKEFRVASVLEGSVRRELGKVRVNVQLISTLDGYHLWSATYDRDVASELELQRELARTVSTDAMANLARLATDAAGGARDGAEAVGLFRQGTALLDWNYDHVLASRDGRPPLSSVNDLKRAIGYLERAVTLNPQYARAHAALAQSYASISDLDPDSPSKMRAAAQRALRLDPGIAAAHAVLGYSHFLYEWDFAGAEREFKQALDLQPRLPGVYRLYGDAASLQGHSAEALEVIDRGAAIFPDSPVIVVARAMALYHAGNYGQMARDARRLAEARPDYHPAYWLLGLALEQMGDREGALRQFDRCLQLVPNDPRAKIARAYTLAGLGRRSETQTAIDGYKRRPGGEGNASYALAMLYTAMGGHDAAFAALNRAYELRDNSLPYLKLDPRFAALHGDGRYVALTKRLRLN